MNKFEKLYKNTLIYAIGNFSSRALGFLMLPLYTFYLSTSQYGYYDLIITTVSLLMPLILLQIPESMYRFVLGKNENDNNIISTSFVIVIKSLLLFNLAYIIFVSFFNFELYLLILLQINTTAISRFYLQIARAKEKVALYSYTGLLMSVVIVITNIVFLIFMDWKVEALLISTVLSNIVSILIIEVKLKVRKYISFSGNNKLVKKELLRFALPLIPTSLIWWIMNLSDRFLITYFLGSESNGIYAVASKIPSIITIIYSFYNLAWQDSAIKEMDKNDHYYSVAFHHLSIFMTSTVIVFIAYSNTIFNILFDSSYSQATEIMPYLLIGSVFYCFAAFYGIGFRTSKETSGELKSSIIGAILNLIINLLTIPIYGIKGAAIATMISFFAVWIYRILLTKTYYNIVIKKSSMLLLLILGIFTILISQFNNPFYNYINIIIATTFYFFINKSLIFNTLKIIRRKVRN